MLEIANPCPEMFDPAVTTWTFPAVSESDTRCLGLALGSIVTSGSVIALNGELGAGKTFLVRAIVEGLDGHPEDVSSPTFVLLQHYAARLPVYHADAYRMRTSAEFLELGVDDWLGVDGLSLVEWGVLVRDALPRDHLVIGIELTGTTARQFNFSATGDRSASLLHAPRDTLQETTSDRADS